MVLAAQQILHHDSGGLLKRAASRRDGYILTKGLVARPGIYLYEINGQIVRELVPREVLQDPIYMMSYTGKPLTVVHNPGDSGPHYTIDELGAGLISGATGFAKWNEEEDAQEVQVNIWTADGRDAYEAGARFLSPAYPARVHFHDEPQFDPEFGWHDAVQVERGEVNHTTQTDDPRGGPRMAIKGDSGRTNALLLQRADANHTNSAYPNYGQQAPQQPQAQHIHYHGDMNGAQGGGGSGGGGSMEQAIQALLQAQQANGEKLDKLIEIMSGKQQAAGDGQLEEDGMPKGDAAQVAYYNERQSAIAVADSMGVSFEDNWTNKKLKRAIVQARNPRLQADASDALVSELFKTIEIEQGDAARQPSTHVRQRHQHQGRALNSGAPRARNQADSRSAPVRFDELFAE